MTEQEIKILAKLVQKIVQTEIAKSQKKLISEISNLKKSAPLKEVVTKPYVNNSNVAANSATPTLDFIREMVGGSFNPNELGEYDDMPPTVTDNDPTQIFVKDYSLKLKKMEESAANRSNLPQ